MKTRKIKLLASITSLVLVFAVMAVGVWAATQHTFQMTSNVSYKAVGVKGTLAATVTGHKEAVEDGGANAAYATGVTGSTLAGEHIGLVKIGNDYFFGYTQATTSTTNAAFCGHKAFTISGETTTAVSGTDVTLVDETTYTYQTNLYGYVAQFDNTWAPNQASDTLPAWNIGAISFATDEGGNPQTITYAIMIANTHSANSIQVGIVGGLTAPTFNITGVNTDATYNADTSSTDTTPVTFAAESTTVGGVANVWAIQNFDILAGKQGVLTITLDVADPEGTITNQNFNLSLFLYKGSTPA